jgi:hypothetical protein
MDVHNLEGDFIIELESIDDATEIITKYNNFDVAGLW